MKFEYKTRVVILIKTKPNALKWLKNKIKPTIELSICNILLNNTYTTTKYQEKNIKIY